MTHAFPTRRSSDLVGYRGGEAHEAHVEGEVDHHLLPHGTAVGVLEEVHLVEHHVAQPAQRVGPRVDHVAEHLGGHDHYRRVAVYRVVAGEQADLVGAVAPGQETGGGSCGERVGWEVSIALV